MVVIGDTHGKLDMLKELMALIPRDGGVCLVGDMVDRGPHSRELMDYVRRQGISTVRGNHEQMMVDSLLPHIIPGRPANNIYARQDWLRNGALPTLESYGVPRDEALEVVYGRRPMPSDLVNDVRWMACLPYYIEYKHIKDGAGRYLVVSHSGVHSCWDTRDTEQGREACIWDRAHSFSYTPGSETIYNVFGHTPLSSPFIKDNFACIDTGAFSNNGSLTALDFPSMKLYSVKNPLADVEAPDEN